MAPIQVNPDILRRETAQLLGKVEKEMKKYEDSSEHRSLTPFEVQHGDKNDYILLVNAKLTALNTLALLNLQKGS